MCGVASKAGKVYAVRSWISDGVPEKRKVYGVAYHHALRVMAVYDVKEV